MEMKIEIVWKLTTEGVRKKARTVEFDSMQEGLKFIMFNSPMKVVAIRINERDQS